MRTWLAHSEPTGATPGELPPGAIPSSSVSAAAISIPGYLESSHSGVSGSLSTVQEPKRSRAPLVLGALLLIGLLGAGGFLLTRSARSVGAASGAPNEPNPAPAVAASAGPAPVAESPASAPSAALPPPTPASALGVAPADPRPATRGSPGSGVRPKKKKPSDDVDLRNPYR